MSATTVNEKKYYHLTLSVNESDGYVSFSKLIESIDQAKAERRKIPYTPSSKVAFSQWEETECGTVAMKSFSRAHQQDASGSHYLLRKGVPRQHAGTYIHPHLILPVILWRDNFSIIYFGNILSAINTDIIQGKVPPLAINDDISEDMAPISLQEDEKKIREIIPSAQWKTKYDRLSKRKGGGTAKTQTAAGAGSTSTPEAELHILLSNLLQKPFTKARPSWLKNIKTGYPMELDMYNEELKLAIEYNGPQHYQIIRPFTNTMEEVQELREKDILKSQLCRDHGVRLITIPYTVPRSKFAEYLTTILSSFGLLGNSQDHVQAE